MHTESPADPGPSDPLPAWEQRLRAGRVGLPDWAWDAPERCVVTASAHGVVELHSWTVGDGQPPQPLTDRAEGTAHGTIDPSGTWIWWFDDADGDEYGLWRRQPFGAGPGEQVSAAAELPAAYSAGLALGRDGLAVIGSSDDGYGTRIHVLQPEAGTRLLYEHTEDAGVGALSECGRHLAITHSEHGDSRHPAVRVLRVADAGVLGELWDGPERGLEAMGFDPTDPHRLLLLHERAGRGALLVWHLATGEQHEIDLGVPGEVSEAEFTRDGRQLLVAVDHQARTRLYRHTFATDQAPAETVAIGPSEGTVLAASSRPDGDVWLLWSSAATPPAVRRLDGTVLLSAPGHPAPASVTVQDVWVEGPGGQVHALLRTPAAGSAPWPLLIDVHGGPTAHDGDWFRAYPAAWVDHGMAVLQVNYRGSTGYGSAWRDALTGRVGHVELQDVVAARDHLVDRGLVDPTRIVLAGASWGGYLTLLGLGTHPDRWQLGVAGVPVADYVAAYEDEMEGLKAFDRSLFGGSPEQVPQQYADSSPLSYVDQVRAPVLILAGRNDPRCPIRQIDNYVRALAERALPHETYHYDAGHGSLVDDERVRQLRVELDFVHRHLPGGLPVRP